MTISVETVVGIFERKIVKKTYGHINAHKDLPNTSHTMK